MIKLCVMLSLVMGVFASSAAVAGPKSAKGDPVLRCDKTAADVTGLKPVDCSKLPADEQEACRERNRRIQDNSSAPII